MKLYTVWTNNNTGIRLSRADDAYFERGLIKELRKVVRERKKSKDEKHG